MSLDALMSSSGRSTGTDRENDQKNEHERLARARAVALQQAFSIEEKKKLQTKVLDMILTAFDLPSSHPADPANPSHADAITFRQCLATFRPTDLDELVSERNIDDRCGYALCKRPNLKQSAKMTWDAKGKLVEKRSDSQWCSKQCKARNNFVRRQLSDEPVWLRQEQAPTVVLLVEGPQPLPDVPQVTFTEDVEQDHKQGKLAEERGPDVSTSVENIIIVEKKDTTAPTPPELADSGLLDGLPVRTVGIGRKI